VTAVDTAQPASRRLIHVDDVEHFLTLGMGAQWIAGRLGVRVDSVRSAMRRQGRDDLAERLR
jgi:hypothetical protein